jgi:hypothetical protein
MSPDINYSRLISVLDKTLVYYNGYYYLLHNSWYRRVAMETGYDDTLMSSL